MKDNMQNSTKNNMKRFVPYFAAIALSSTLTGCCLEEEKSYEYYLEHPAELYHDYRYCETHPSAGVCFNIVSKYFHYQSNTSYKSNNYKSNNQHKLSKGDIFRNIDEPISSFGTDYKS